MNEVAFLDEELFREMNEEDDLYMGDYDDQDDDTQDYDEIQHHNGHGINQSSQSSGMGCLVMLPLLAGTLTFVILLIL